MSFDLKEFAEGWLNYARATMDPESVSPDARKLAEERSTICRACPKFQNLLPENSRAPIRGRCRECGCVFPAMVYAIGKSCPLNKW